MTSATANISNNIPEYSKTTSAQDNINNFLVDIGYTVPALNTWFLNPRLQCTFVYLAEDERNVFASKPLSYVLPQVMYIPNDNITQRTTFDIDLHNPLTRSAIRVSECESYS